MADTAADDEAAARAAAPWAGGAPHAAPSLRSALCGSPTGGLLFGRTDPGDAAADALLARLWDARPSAPGMPARLAAHVPTALEVRRGSQSVPVPLCFYIPPFPPLALLLPQLSSSSSPSTSSLLRMLLLGGGPHPSPTAARDTLARLPPACLPPTAAPPSSDATAAAAAAGAGEEGQGAATAPLLVPPAAGACTLDIIVQVRGGEEGRQG